MNINSKLTRKTAVIMAFLMVCLFLVPEIPVSAKDSFVSQYIQTVYNQKNGIGSNEVNCLLQSSSGYIWVGTDGGLYRSNGAEFKSINLWDTDRADVYSINCLMQTEDGRVFIGTDNYGLFYVEGGETYHLQSEYYDGIKSINDICQAEDGTIYVATGSGLYVCESDESGSMCLNSYADATIADFEFTDIETRKDELWAIYGSNSIYVMKDGTVKTVIDTRSLISDELSTMERIGDEIYVGGTGRDIICYKSRVRYTLMSAAVEGINGFMMDKNGYLWTCADNGLGFFDSSGNFVKTNDCEINSYVSDMIQDYEGNYWIASTRMGVLLLSRSKFVDYNMYTGMQDTMVNAVYIHNGKKYIGSDAGLIIYDSSDERVNNELTDMLNGISVRHIMSDSAGNLWISTYRKYGVVRVSPGGSVVTIGRGANLPSMSINKTLELKDGNIAVATDDGIAILDKQGSVKNIYNEKNGLTNSHVLALYQGKDEKLYAGTDGGGIYIIGLGPRGTIENYDSEQGLNSNVVTSIEEGSEGIWIGTDNGLCFYNEAFRSVSNVEVSNSIYDVIIHNDYVWIVGSMGILHATEEELLGSQGVSERYLDSNDGLNKAVNTTGNSYIDRDDRLYVCCNTGICTLDTGNIPYNTVPPKIKVTSINVDGVIYEFDDLVNGLEMKSDVSRVTIDFAVFSFNNRGNMQIEYSLNGFDEKPIVITGNDLMEAVYTNLDGGVYEFTVSAYNGDGVMCEGSVSFTIEKENSFFENPAARIALLVFILIMVVIAVLGILRLRKLLRNKNSALEKLSKEHEEAIKTSSAKNDYLANMSNEIKTPINAMMAKADELLQVFHEDDGNREKIKGIYDIGNDIIGKVDDIILLAKIEAGRMNVVKGPYSITTIIYELAETVMGKISEKSVKFFVEIGENIADNVIGDSEKIMEIVGRLLDNAVKYTKEGSITLAVDCYEYSDKLHHDMVNVVFTVSDTGIGIQEERLDSIFEVYNIADNMKNNIHAGNGIGLAIAKGYADLLEGEIEVQSVYGAGSTFTLSIDQKLADKVSSSHVISKIEDTVSREAAEKLWLPDVKALLVDDDEVSREVSVKVLAQFEMRVDVASSGMGAIDMVMNSDYDVVFMDLAMPIMNGMDAMREIRDLDGKKYGLLPIIAMDMDAIEENKAGLLGEGFTDSLIKPIEARRVAAILKDCLPGDKIKEKSNDIALYIEGSRYSEGLYKMKEYIDVESAIERIGGSIDVFNKLVVAFYNQNTMAIEELYDKVGKDTRSLKAKIHTLRTNSANIGAMMLSQKAARLEAAINIGNREYVSENLETFTDNLLDVLVVIESYISYMDSVSGISDEEYAMRKQTDKEVAEEEDLQKQDETLQTISFGILESIKYDALEGNFKSVDLLMDSLRADAYSGEDREFIVVLAEAVENRSVETIDELVTTYMDLKM